MNNNTEMKSVGEMCDEIKSLKEEIYGDTFWGINQGLRKEKSDLILQQKRMVKEIIKVKKDKAALITENDQLGEEIDALKSSVIHLRQLLPKQAWELSQAQGDCRHDRAELSYLRQSRDRLTIIGSIMGLRMISNVLLGFVKEKPTQKHRNIL